MSATSVQRDAASVARRVDVEIMDHLRNSRHFLVEAGAGSGKTTSLISTLQSIRRKPPLALRQGSQIACVTYTNVAKTEILTRVDSDSMFRVSTIHEFGWSLLQAFQHDLLSALKTEDWAKELEKAGLDALTTQRVEYSRGYRRISDSVVYLRHDDVPRLLALFLQSQKFITVMRSRFPIILIDEYQDTHAGLVDALLTECVEAGRGPILGFFGDAWQQIYPGSVGAITSSRVAVVPKGTNFRSSTAVVGALNKMRPELAQAVPAETMTGEVRVLHTNDWHAGRVGGSPSMHDLNADMADLAIAQTRDALMQNGWNLDPSHTKTLVLTHKAIAARQGYPTINGIFMYKEEYTKLENVVLEFLVNDLEEARAAFDRGDYGNVFDALGLSRPEVRSQLDKRAAMASLRTLMAACERTTVQGVLAELANRPLAVPPQLSTRLAALERGELDAREDDELRQLLQVPYAEVIALKQYLTHFSPYETKHGVKGAQFENVLVILGGGWNHYKWPEFLMYSRDPDGIPVDKQAGYKRARNLFYVSASRPRERLALLFTQKLDEASMSVLASWFGQGSISALTPPE